jgi:hypothetical protein
MVAKKFPSFYGTRKLITMYLRAPPLVTILSQMEPINIPVSLISEVQTDTKC